LVSVSDRTDLLGLHDVFHAILGWTGDCLFDRTQVDWEQQGLPDGPITVGIDGGYVRAAHKEGWFEVIAGKSVVAFRREAEDETPSAKCFAVEHPHVVEARGTDVSTRLEQRSFVIRKSNSNSFRRVCENLTDSCESHTKR
jgi:hypothetical protein